MSDIARQVIDHPAGHMRVLGPPGSGKTSLLIERFKTLQMRHGESDGESDGVFILTYSAESYRRLTNAVFEKGTARVGPPRVLTYTRLAKEIIESSGGRPPLIATDLEERLLIENVIADVEPQMKSELRSICRSERFRGDLLEVCHLLLQNNVVGRALAGLKDLAAKNLELADVLVLYEGFRKTLASRKATTYYDIAWHAAECWRSGIRRHPVAKAAAILVEDFQDVDAGQFELLTSIAPPGGPAFVNVFGDPMGSVFARRGTQHGFLIDEFPRLYGGETFFLRARSAEGGAPEATLEALLEEMLAEDRGAYLPVDHSDRTAEADDLTVGAGGALRGFRIEKVANEVDEVYVVAARIAELLRTEAFRPEEIAIVTNEKSRYAPLLGAAATQRGIPLDTGREKKRVFADFVDALLALVDSPDDSIAARAVLTSPLFRYLRATFPTKASRTPATELGAVDELRSFVEDFRKAIRSSDVSAWMRVIAQQVLHPVCEAYSNECEDDRGYREVHRLLEAWDRYIAAVNAWGGRASVGAFAALEAAFSTGRAPGAAGAVGFYSCREVKGRFFPAVFVLGCSELLFPSAARSENVLPMDALEEALRFVFRGRPLDVYRARSAARQLSEEHHLLYIALTRSKQYLHVTAPETFSGDDYPAPSAVLKRTIPQNLYCRMDAGSKTPPQIRFAREWVKGTPLPRSAEPAAIHGGCAPDVPRDLDSPRPTGSRPHAPDVLKVLDTLSPAGSRWRAPAPAAEPVRLTPFALSKSSLEMFLTCERRFFYRKVLRIPEDEAPPAKVGSLLHGVMAELGRRFPSKAALVSGATESVIRELIDDTLRNDKNVGKASFYNLSLRHYLGAMVVKILDIERDDPESYAITGIEQDLRFTFGPWEFAGRIDRVQETPAGEKVIVDYKTGKMDKMGKTLRRKTLIALDAPADANWQVPLYAWGLKTTEGALPRAFTHIVTSPREDPFVVTLFFSRGSGGVPHEAASGKRSSYLLEAEIEEIMEKAAAVASEIFTARSRFEKTNDTSACRNCDFRRLCGREER